MKIKLCCPYFNERLVAKVNIQESSKWADEIHITEFNKSFKYSDHDFDFPYTAMNKVYYHSMDAEGKYLETRHFPKPPHLFVRPITRWMKHYCYYTGWYNEAVSRNNTAWNANIEDDDIVVLSDIDEIINPKDIDYIIENVKRYNVVTIKLHFTQFYFNLFTKGFGGPADYSYRMFALKGIWFRKRFRCDSDYLRKLGEQMKLMDEVKLLDVWGFHHSWLGDEKFILNKLKSYAHVVSDHNADKICTNGEYDIEKIRTCLGQNEAIFPNCKMVKNDTIPLLSSVEALRLTHPKAFL